MPGQYQGGGLVLSTRLVAIAARPQISQKFCSRESDCVQRNDSEWNETSRSIQLGSGDVDGGSYRSDAVRIEWKLKNDNGSRSRFRIPGGKPGDNRNGSRRGGR